MTFPRSLAFAAVATIAASVLLVLGASELAAAAVPPARYSRTASTTAGATTNVVSPSSCVQYADNPHRSSHYPGTMAGAIRAVCKHPVPEMSHSSQMWETRWWGWDRIGRKGYLTAYYHREGQAVSADDCKSSTIRTTGTGFVIDLDGQHYYASTESKHIKNPCGL